jgi:hypothetical protein
MVDGCGIEVKHRRWRRDRVLIFCSRSS